MNEINEIYTLLYVLLTICLLLRTFCIYLTFITLETRLYIEANPLMKGIIHKKGLIVLINIIVFSLCYFSLSVLLFFGYIGVGLFILVILFIPVIIFCGIEFILDLIGFIHIKIDKKESS